MITPVENELRPAAIDSGEGAGLARATFFADKALR
jgi:hypothetical protein